LSFPSLLPDILLIALGFLVLGLDLLRVRSSRIWTTSCVGLAAIFAILNMLPLCWHTEWFGGNWTLSNFGLLMREFFVLSGLIVILLSKRMFQKGEEGFPALRGQAEFIAAVLFVSFGSITVVSAHDLLTLFVGLELATIPLYLLVAWNKKDVKASEAATKYVLMGSTSTAVMLFGLSYLYGLAGSLRFDEIATAVATMPDSPLLWIGVLFLFAGIGFKLTLFPFHTWAPDVYDGGTTTVTAFLSVSSKATAISFLWIMLYGPLGAVHTQIEPLVALLAVATMTIGNFGALKQTRLRRFMAWSSIAQAGYILVALTGPGPTAKSAIAFYLFVYAFSNYLIFFLMNALGEKREQSFANLAGLAKERPWLGAALAIALFSLAGVPPVAGFIGKFMLFTNAARGGHFAMLVLVGINTVISFYCYIQMLKAGWVTDADPEIASANRAITLSKTERITMVILTLLVLGAGVTPWLSNNITAMLQYAP